MLINPQGEENFSVFRFESMLKTNKVLFFDSEEFENIIDYYLTQGKIQLAKRALKFGLQQHPSSLDLRLFQVEIFVFEDKLDLAERLIEELVLIDPTYDEIHIQKASILSKRGLHREAINSLHTALQLSPNDPDVLSMLGMELLFEENFDEAKSIFIRSLEEDPEDYSSLYNLVYCFELLEKPDEAIFFLESFIDKNPYSEVAWHELGRQYYQLKNYEKALTAFDYANLIDESFIGAYIEKGKTLEKLKKYIEAVENYKITLKLDDPSSFALLRIGRCYEKLNKPNLAMRYYREAVHIDPLLDKGWIKITRFYIRKGQYQKAFESVRKAVNLDGENPVYWLLMAHINHKTNRHEAAVEAYVKAISLGDFDVRIWVKLADALCSMNEWQQALDQLVIADTLFPEDARVKYRMAALFYLLGHTQKAKNHLKKALESSPEQAKIVSKKFPVFFQSDLFGALANIYQKKAT